MSRPTKPAGGRGATGAPPTAAASINVFDPIEVARSDPYFKRNHMGRVTCTLCNIVCNDENAFTKHVAGKTHTLQLENMDRQRRKRLRLEEEMRMDEAKAAAAAKERAARQLLAAGAGKTAGGGGSVTTVDGVAMVTGPFGVPTYAFRTEHLDLDVAAGTAKPSGTAESATDAEAPAEVVTAAARELPAAAYRTKVWLSFEFSKAEEGARPLHRWLSAREQHMETPADDYFVYLLVACAGYTTVALKFPAKLRRSQEGDARDESGESVFRCWWDPLKREYSLFFILTRE